MKKVYLTLAAVCLLNLASTAQAESGDIKIGLKGGTLGIGVEAGVDVNEYMAMRAGLSYISFSFDTTIANVDYEFEPDFFNGSLLFDVHPFANGFRLTGGAYLNNNTIDINGSYSRDKVPAEYKSIAYLTDLAKVTGSVEFNEFAPYLGLGWTSNHDGPGWGVDLDLGVMFQGAPVVSELSIDDQWGLGDTELAKRLLEEERKAIEDELDSFEYYPVASIAITYKF